MINAAIIDKNKNTIEILTSYLKEIENIEKIFNYEDLSQLELDKNINLVIFDINSKNSDETITLFKNLKENNQNIRFVATSYEINSSLVSQTLKNGVDDFQLKPILKNILENSIKKIFSSFEDKIKSYSKVISIYSAKGGIGTSSIAANIGYEIFSRTTKNVCLLDLSLNCEEIYNFLNIKSTDLNLILSSLKKADKNMMLSLIPKYENTNLYALSINNQLLPNFKLTPEFIKNLISSLRNIFDYIIIDMPNIIDEKSIEILINSNLILYTTILNSNAAKLALNSFEMFNRAQIDNSRIKVLINRFMDSSKDELEKFTKETKKTVSYKIPNNYLTLIDAINQMRPLNITNPQANITKAIKNIAQDLINLEYKNANTASLGIFGLLNKRGD